MGKNRDSETVPVSAERVRLCLESAAFWVEELPRFADRNQRRADSWAIASGILAALTSLAIWPVVADSAATWAKILVSAVALAAAVCALVPRIVNYSETAGQARELASRYGSLTGKLTDLHVLGEDLDQTLALSVVTEFEATKAKKDSLRSLPDRLKVEKKRALRTTTTKAPAKVAAA